MLFVLVSIIVHFVFFQGLPVKKRNGYPSIDNENHCVPHIGLNGGNISGTQTGTYTALAFGHIYGVLNIRWNNHPVVLGLALLLLILRLV